MTKQEIKEGLALSLTRAHHDFQQNKISQQDMKIKTQEITKEANLYGFGPNEILCEVQSNEDKYLKIIKDSDPKPAA